MNGIAELIADTYKESSLAGADMREIARTLEMVREEWNKSGSAADSPYVVWGWLDVHVAATDDPGLVVLLSRFRHRLSSAILEEDLARIQKAFSRGAAEGWLTWRRAFGAALSHTRLSHCVTLAAEPPRLSQQVPDDIAAVVQSTPGLAHQRWAECYGLFSAVARWEDIDSSHRASAAIAAADIQMYYFLDLATARSHVDDAKQLSGGSDAAAVEGRWHIERRERPAGRACFEQAIAREPNRAKGHIGLGDVQLFDPDPDPDGAERAYRRATRCSDDCTTAYLRLLQLYERPDWFADNEPIVMELFDRVVRSEPLSQVSALLTIGDVYAANALREKQRMPGGNTALHHYENLREKALRFYDDADATDIERPDALLRKGRFLTGIGEIDTARACLELAHSRPGGEVSAAWQLALLEKVILRWSEVTRWSERVITERPGWRRVVLGVLGEARLHLGDVDAAERDLLEALRLDRENSHAMRALEQLSQKHATERHDDATARRILDEIRNALGETYDATYYNRIGILQFERRRYEEAAESFRLAVRRKPDDAVMQSNLANAGEQVWNVNVLALEWADEALAALGEARRLDPKNPAYHDRFDRLERLRRLTPVFGQKGVQSLLAVTPIAIEAAANLKSSLVTETGALEPKFLEHLADMKWALHYHFGFEVPHVRVRINEFDLPDGTYIIMVREIPLVSGTVDLTRGLCNETVERLAALNVKGEEAVNPANGSECSWVQHRDWQKVQDAGLKIWTPKEYIVLHLSAVFRKNLTEFATVQVIADLLKEKAADHSASILSAPGGLPRFASVIRALLSEEVPIKNLSSICEGYLTNLHLPTYEIPEEIRRLESIRRDIQGNAPDTPIYRLGGNFVSLVGEGIQRDGEKAVLALEPEPTQEALTAVRNEISNLPPTSKNPVLFVEDWRMRPFVRKLVELEFPHLAVLSRREAFAPDAMPVLATIELEQDTRGWKR